MKLSRHRSPVRPVRPTRLAVLGVVGATAGLLALTGCGADNTVHIVGFSVLKGANAAEIAAFQATDAGKDVKFDESYGASGAQRDMVLAGGKASEVHLSLEPDMTKLADAGLVASNWKDNSTDGICTDSVVVFVVRKGNPLGIKTWADIVDKKASVVTPDPASSGSAKWNLLAAYGSTLADGGSADDAATYMKSFLGQVATFPGSGRDATTAFEGGTGDVLISYENEAIEEKQADADIDYVVPDNTLLIQNPCAVTTDAPAAASAFLDFQKSAPGQTIYADAGFRPLPGVDVGTLDVQGANDSSDPFPDPSGKLQTIDDDFGGWSEANTKYFGSGTDGQALGILTDLKNQYGAQ